MDEGPKQLTNKKDSIWTREQKNEQTRRLNVDAGTRELTNEDTEFGPRNKDVY